MSGLAFRTTRPDDIPEMLALLPPPVVPDLNVRKALSGIWEEWLASGHMHARTVEYRRPHQAASIEAFGAAVFLDEGFVRELLANPQPFVASAIYQAARSGTSPLLSREQVAAANWVDGLNLFILHYCQRDPRASPVPFEDVLTVAHAAFRDVNEGYDLKLLLQEAFMPGEREFLLAGGMRVISDFSQTNDGPSIPEMPGPCLMGMTREDASRALPGTTVSFVFKSRPPVFYFTPAQQRVLELAIRGDTDADIALQLAVSPDAVKQTWRAIYSRTEAVGTLAHAGGTRNRDVGSNHQRRRLLLDYLRAHPEERRPVRRPRD